MLLDSSLVSDRSLAAARRNGELINLERFDAVLTRAFRATRCRAVALVINSPGGSPAQSSLIYKRLRELRRRHPKTKLIAYVQERRLLLQPTPGPGPDHPNPDPDPDPRPRPRPPTSSPISEAAARVPAKQHIYMHIAGQRGLGRVLHRLRCGRDRVRHQLDRRLHRRCLARLRLRARP